MKPGRGPRNHPKYLAFSSAALLVFMSAFVPTARAQQPHPDGHPPPVVMMAVSRVVVPDVRGRRAEDAQSILRKAGLQPGSTSQSPGPGAVGSVWRQEPEQNAVVVRGTKVDLVLVAPRGDTNPDGDEGMSRQVPSLTGLTPSQASNLLERSRLGLGGVQAGSGQGSPGTIYAQKPQAGSWVKLGSRIDVEISEPPKTSGQNKPSPVIVPNLYGQTEKGAAQILNEAGLHVGNVITASASAAPDTIFAQDPLPDTRVRPGTLVNIRIAGAKPVSTFVTVPSLLQRDVTSAGTILQQSRLQLGEVGSEDGEKDVNLIVSQSPAAGSRVEAGTSVSVVVAHAIPLVAVPDVRQREEQAAIEALDAAGLEMGTVSEQESDASTGTILAQNPSPGTQVRAATSVNVTVSRQRVITLTVMADTPNPKVGDTVNFHAHMDPTGKGYRYRFIFGDGVESDVLTSSTTPHKYAKKGNYVVYALAIQGNKTIESDRVDIQAQSVPIPPIVWLFVAAGILGISGSGFLYHGWRLFQRTIRVVPRTDLGKQALTIESRNGWNENVRLRLRQSIGEFKVIWPAGQEPRKAGTP
jgi:beta-lactam-binding protein with PASTA domain